MFSHISTCNDLPFISVQTIALLTSSPRPVVYIFDSKIHVYEAAVAVIL